jgi:hypothetical protein
MGKQVARSGLNASLVGTWRCESRGISENDLRPIPPGKGKELLLRADGTAEYHWLDAQGRPTSAAEDPAAPFPPTWVWEKNGKGVLTILVPIAPMPDYDIPDWTREEMSYQVLNVSADKLILSDRPFDGEFVEVYVKVGTPLT